MLDVSLSCQRRGAARRELARALVHLQTLVETMDTLRGDDCKLAGVRKGEDVPADCLFWRASVES